MLMTTALPMKEPLIKNYRQTTDTVIMVRPHRFQPNPQTAKDNSFQTTPDGYNEETARKAYDEVSAMVQCLNDNGITVHLFEDDGRNNTPDSVFPNNWITTHEDGTIGVHPMQAENRRLERRDDVLEFLKSKYKITTIIDDSPAAERGMFLEGTGVLILDRINKTAFMCRSQRTNQTLLEKFCNDFGYQAIAFDATDQNGVPIYHTNVMMCIGTDFALVGLETIPEKSQRQMVYDALENAGKEVISLSFKQIENFAGNALELEGAQGKILALSETAYNILTAGQIRTIRQYAEPLPISIPTIEKAGGSVRCMLAEVFLIRI